jgi:hypothetical protein
LSAAAALFDAGAARDAAIASAVSAILLAVVDRIEGTAGRQPARVLADIALMTPAIMMTLHR